MFKQGLLWGHFLILSSTCLAMADASTPAGASVRQERIERSRERFLQGLGAYNANDYRAAYTHFIRAQQAWRSPAIAFNIARVCEHLGEAQKGMYWFRAFLTHGDPDEATTQNVRQRIQQLQELYERQRGQIFQAPPSTDELTEQSRIFFVRGVEMFARKEYSAAMQAFTAAMQYAPFPELLYNMAVTAETMGTYRDAADYYREYLRLNPGAPDGEKVKARIRELRRQR